MENVSPDPERTGSFSPEVLYKITTTPGVILVHSHPDGWLCPSETDMRSQQMLGVPFVILPLSEKGPLGSAFAFGHEYDAPFEGRVFRHGIFDCYELCRDWYRINRGINLPNVPRSWDWWRNHPEKDFYSKGYYENGFREIPMTDAIQEGDAILYQLRSSVAQHAAIVLNQNIILHHPSGMREYDRTRLSTRDLRARWSRFAVKALRYGA